MLKSLRHFNGIRRAGNNAQVAHGAQLQVIYKFIKRLFLFPLGADVELSYNFNCCIRARQLTGGATGTGVFIVLVMEQNHFTFKSLRKN